MVLFERMLSVWLIGMLVIGANLNLLLSVECRPHRILLDTDLDTDDVFALFYLLKLDRSLFRFEGVTINTNGWSNAGHAVNQVYDILYMMGRDDVSVGVGGEGGILDDGTILPDVGGYLSVIDQENTTFGGCRYRQAIPIGPGGRLDIDTAYGIRRSFLPQGLRKYCPLQQATAQQVLVEKISEGPISVLIIGAHTNMALFLMNHPHLKRNIEYIYAMGGGIRSKSPRGCSVHPSLAPAQCGEPGNLFIDSINNPYAEFNIFADPFAAYRVIHSGVPITLVPLDATDTIPVTEDFFKAFERVQDTTPEAKYCYNLLKMSHDTWFDDQFYTSYFMWDSFMAGVAVSMMSTNSHEENEFAEMEYMNITVVTSNEPYGVSDGSNPFFDRHYVPKFNLNDNGVHSGHVQTGIQDPFCKTRLGKGKCQDGYTKEVTGEEGARVLVATRAKPNRDARSPLNREFFTSFLDVLSRPENSGRFNFTTQCSEYREVSYKPDFGGKRLGKPLVFDMDMSAGDFLSLFYLLKVPVEVIDLKAIIVSPSGWANGATIDVVYDVLHMMGRDDIPVGLGDFYAINQHDPSLPSAGDCKYAKAIPHGSGGFLDSDTLYGLARDLPRSPRRYTAEKSAGHGARKDTDHPELRQPMGMEIWDSVFKTLDPESKITVLTNGPLTNLAKMILSHENATSRIKEVYVVGGHIRSDGNEKGNVFAIGSNHYAEYNMFLDPHAAKAIFESTLNITLAPLNVQRTIASFPTMLARLRLAGNTPEAAFSKRLISRLHRLKKKHHRYQHTEMFLGEILGAVVLAGDGMDPKYQIKPVRVVAKGDESEDGEIVIDEKGKPVKILTDIDVKAFYELYVQRMSDEKHSAVIGSFEDQQRSWGECSENRSYRRRLWKRF